MGRANSKMQGSIGSNRGSTLALSGAMFAINAAAWTVAAAPAAAQDPQVFQRVSDRFRPEYSTPPLTLGSFEVAPRIEADVEFIDNIFASDVVSASDTVISIRPSVDIRDRREDRQLALRLATGYQSYLENRVEDRLLFNANASGRFGLGTLTRPFFNLDFSRNNSRSSTVTDFLDTAQPLKITRYGGRLGAERDFGDFTAIGEGRYRSTQYDGDLLINDQVFDGGLQDFDVITGRFRLAYTPVPAQRFYAELIYNKGDFDDVLAIPGLPANLQTNRSSDGYTLTAGFSRQLTEVLQLDVNAGYIRQDYEASAFDSISSVSFDANLFWSPTRLTTIQARASRTIDESSDPLFSGLLRTEFSGALQHELRRDLVLSGEAQYATISAQGQRLQGATGNGSELSLSAAARYYISPRWSMQVRGEFFDRKEVFPGSQTRILLGAQYNF